jgi:hypothetical protein
MYRIQPSICSKVFSVAGRQTRPAMPTLANIVSLVQKWFLNPTPARGCLHAWMPNSILRVGLGWTSPPPGFADTQDSLGFLRWAHGYCCSPRPRRCRRRPRPLPTRVAASPRQRKLRQRSRPSITLSIIITMPNRKPPSWRLLPWFPRHRLDLRNNPQTLRPSSSTTVC